MRAIVAPETARIIPTAPSLRLMLSEKERVVRLAYWLRDVRLRQRLTVPKLADLIGVSRGTVNRWEAGDQVPSMIWLGPLCAALKVDPRLFADLPPIPPSPASEYIVGQVVLEGLEEGKRRARRPRAAEAPSGPAPSPLPPSRAGAREQQ